MKSATSNFAVAKRKCIDKLESKIPKIHRRDIEILVGLAAENGEFSIKYKGIGVDEIYNDAHVLDSVIAWLRELGYSTMLDLDKEKNTYSVEIFWNAPKGN